LDAYHIGDARKILSVLPAIQFVDTTITSPPYWNLKDYKSKKQVGFGQRYDQYLDDLEKIAAAVHRITKKTGSLWVVADTIKHDGELKLFPFDLAERLKRVGWVLHDIIVWHKDKTLPWSHRGKLRNIFEYILFFSKGKRFKYYLRQVRETEGLKEWWVRYPERYSPQGKAPTRTWSIPIPRQGSWGKNWVQHFCPFPPELVRRIVLLTTKKRDVVLDPFAGSGVVLAQAEALGRHYVGLDLRKSYRRMFALKVRPSVIALERNNEQTGQGERKKRSKFAAVIWKLRKTKYPRELLRLYEKSYGKTGVVGVFARSRKTHALVVVFIFGSDKRPPKAFVARLERLKRCPPLSKYGLSVKLRVRILGANGKLNARQNGFHPRETLNLYLKGKTYRAHSQVTTKKFLESLRNGLGHEKHVMPPLVSNIRVTASKGSLS
ncbi:MAG: DNA-methyltransferase, partial [Terriglobia bacterium]